MRLMIASDIHGSSYYAKLFFEKVKQEKPDKIILLGDIYYHGPRNPFPKDYAPMEVAAILNQNKDNIVVIKGNCDSEVDQMVSDFTFIEGFFVVQLEGRKLVCVHGHKMEKEDLPEINKGDIIAYGHYHTGLIENKNGVIYINPGSLALPKEEATNSYIILDRHNIELKDINGNLLKKYSYELETLQI